MNTTEDLVKIGLLLLSLTAVGLLASIILGARAGLKWFMGRREFNKTHEVALIEHELQEALVDLELEQFYYSEVPHNYRYNIHCPDCGRFAKKVWGMTDVVECHEHGVVVRWADVPIDWASVPLAEGTTLAIDDTPAFVSEFTIVTGSIDIITAEDVSKFYDELGAKV